ncbi:MAG: 4-alpha-glucanotransferase [Oscillospiraceae bacterium]|nr:4-alpha-glucanotransferase [Oscillospiraceae bacterium]
MRVSGILLGISSLWGDYGIGKMGKEAREFVDFLRKSEQHYWQILPLSPTSYGDSPYQSCSVYAGNPYLIDLETLERDGLLKASEYKTVQYGDNPRYINYGMLYETVWDTLRIAFSRFVPDENYKAFLEKESRWVENYALFMALKDENGGLPWFEWDKPLKMAEPEAIAEAKNRLSKEIDFYIFIQYEFYKQWYSLKKYANDKGIEIIGDMPIYCAHDSVDVWLNPELFELDEDRNPVHVAGCPPDDYATKGQLWGNPLYDWKKMQLDGYNWWVQRIAHTTDIYDVVRIDHFRGFAGYYSIPYGDEDAINGKWEKGPGMELFNSANYWLGKKRIIAEDLGLITPDVMKLLKDTEYPGMKALQFAFDPTGKSDYLPCNYTSNSYVAYVSTHDSDTAKGWADGLSGKALSFAKRYLGVKSKKEIPDALIRLGWSSTADVVIAQPQDFLELGNEARINVPSTVGTNWRWRISKEELSSSLSRRLRVLTETFNRVPEYPKPKSEKEPDETEK